MVDESQEHKTFYQLVNIFNSCFQTYTPENDISNDLRILSYIEDMKNSRWKNPIYITYKNGEVIDGIHRGIAYLKCINDGISPEILPDIFLEE